MLWPERSTWGPEEARAGGSAAPGVADPRLIPNRTYAFQILHDAASAHCEQDFHSAVDKSLTLHIK